ncbi:MAG: retropepsin-like aspartic protease [Cellvibrio sp.]
MSSKTILVAIMAFAIGFIVSEYRIHLFGTNLMQHDVPAARTVGVNESINPQTPNTGSVSIAEVNINEVEPRITNPATLTNLFSWSQVDQLIADGRYQDAIRLLESRMGEAKDTPRAWLYLASIYKKQSQPLNAVDAWFRYVKLELDDQKIDKALKDIRKYLLQIKETPALFNEDYSWLMSQFDELLKYNSNDGELHLILASMLVQLNDNYQAQYHALMAANDPNAQKRAEAILANLNGDNKVQGESTISLTRFGNQYLVNVSIEGYPARLLLDTGASLSGLSNSYTAKYPGMLKSTKPIRLNTASGTHDSVLFTVTNINMGNLMFNQHILAQLPMDNSQGFDGLLGVDILGRFDFVIDQDAAVLRLKARKSNSN